MSAPANVVWTEFTSSNGKRYQVGTVPQDRSAGRGPAAGTWDEDVTASGPKFGIALDWKVQPAGQSKWKNTTSDVEGRAKLTRFKITQDNGLVFKYQLEITNTDTYNYFFYDEEGDAYQINTFSKGDHWVNYNSEHPTIAYVRGD